MQENILAVDLSTEQVLEVNLPEQDNIAQIDVYWQDEVTLDLDLSLMYIVSGQREIQDYVDNKSKPEIDDYIETYAKPIVSEVVEEIAAPVVGDYIENTVKPEIKDFADAEMANYAQVAGEQATIATEKASEASETAKIVDEKVQEFSQTTEASKTEFVNFAQEKMEEFAQTAEQATTDSQANVEKSRIWAEGEQAEVEPLGGSLSSMGAADLAYAIANAPEDTPIDASGLFAMNVVKGEKGDKGDKGDAGKDGVDGKSVFDGYATNCITEIPQDIKLELADGVLTLKAGSKVYVPNGFEADGVTPKFDVVVIESDITSKQSLWGAYQYFPILQNSGSLLNHISFVSLKVGTTEPTPSSGIWWYDATNNKIKRVPTGGSAWEETDASFPLAIVTSADGSTVASIDQVFNGFGYIGNTVFALPNVKGLIPNGRNEDGSLKNIEFATDKVLCSTLGNITRAQEGFIIIKSDGAFSYTTTAFYDEKLNFFRGTQDGVLYTLAAVGKAKITEGVISNFSIKQPFHAVDRNDSSWIAGQAMPSKKQINLTLGATGSTYIAPANGYFYANQQSTAAGQYIAFTAFGATRAYSSASTQSLQVFLPVPKGETLTVDYTAPTNRTFKFYYVKGEN